MKLNGMRPLTTSDVMDGSDNVTMFDIVCDI
jgi:hypothetical protein